MMELVKWVGGGLSGEDGRLSTSKLVLYVVLLRADTMPVVLGIACLAASFGAKVFGQFLRKSDFKQVDQKIEQVIQARRDPVGGFEPTP